MATLSYTDLRPDNLPTSLLSLETAPHPRLFATASDFSLLREKAAGDGIHHRMLGRLAFLADGLLDVPPAERTMTGRRLLGISRLEVYRISTLGLCYRMTGNPAYRDRCIEELRAIARFQDWNPSHFLDVAEMEDMGTDSSHLQSQHPRLRVPRELRVRPIPADWPAVWLCVPCVCV